MYCKVFELSNCNKKICCNECDDTTCKERCKYHVNECKDSTESLPLSFEEMIEDSINESNKI